VKKQNTLGRGAADAAQAKALLVALSDDLALPLLQIRSGLEILEQSNYSKPAVRAQARLMTMSADSGLQLAEAYRLVLQLDRLADLPLEPVSIGAVLDNVAHELAPYAWEYSTVLEVNVQGRLTPILAHPPSLAAALQVLSSSLIRAQASQTRRKQYRLILGAHKSGGEISAGVYSDIAGLSDKTLRAARSLVGRARQPMAALPAGSASGVLIADVLCAAMWQPLRAAAHGGMHGLAVTVPASKQLQFV
jgi:K+-sensing histidine kinase KdpD